MSDNHDVTGAQTTGHLWDDDLADFTNQPPKWWMLGLTASALWCVIYFIYYPSIPVSSIGKAYPGIAGWTAINELNADTGVVDQVRGKYEAKIKDMTPAAILADSELSEYVTRSGKVLFGDNCAACHGTNGVGVLNKGVLFAPVLNDDDWLYGGKIGDIYATVLGGRMGVMPPKGGQALTDAEIDTLAGAIAQSKPTSTPLFTEKGCVACHGADGKGMAAVGSANLTDQICRFDCTVEGIKMTITHGVNAGDPLGRVGVMPNFKDAGKLSDADMKKLAVYVYKFGGGQAEAPAAPAAPAAEAAPAAK